MPFQNLIREESLRTEVITEAIMEGISVSSYGTVGDGVAGDSAAILRAISDASNRCVLFPPGVYRVDSNVTFPSSVSVSFSRGAELFIDSGKTVTISGKLDAGLYKIFGGDGEVVIVRGAVDYIIPQWWGAVGDGVNDDTSAIQAAINCAMEYKYTEPRVQEVFLPNGIYKITNTLTLSRGTSLRGNGMNSTFIDVYNGVDGIYVINIVTNSMYENPKISDFWLRSKTEGVGVGIDVHKMRGTIIERVHIGGTYAPLYSKIHFEKGIQVREDAAYYVTIRQCMLFHNKYHIYLRYGANDTRIMENDMWYGEYGVYAHAGSAPRILNNTIEGHSVCAIYTKAARALIWGNYIESSGVPSVELGPGAYRCVIQHSACVTGFGGESDVINNSGHEYHRIYDNYIPLGWHAQNDDGDWSLAGRITSDMFNYHARDIGIEAMAGNMNLKIKHDHHRIGKAVHIDGNMSSSMNINTAGGGMGYVLDNQFPSSTYVDGNWNLPNVTAIPNACASPDGKNNGVKILDNGGGLIWFRVPNTSYPAGTVVNFSFWARTDVEHREHERRGVAQLGTSTFGRLEAILFEKEWKRYTVTGIDVVGVPSSHLLCGIYPQGNTIYVWGPQITYSDPVSGIENSGLDDERRRVVDTTKDFMAEGIDVGGLVAVTPTPTNGDTATGTILGINSIFYFTGGDGEEPEEGVTLTGETSDATIKFVNVVITDGSFAGGDAEGYMEFNTEEGVLDVENVSWDSGSATISSIHRNSVLVTYLNTIRGTNKNSCSDGDTYYACSRLQASASPYVPTGSATARANTNAGLVSANIRSTGSLRADGGYIFGIDNRNPMTGTVNSYPGSELVVLNPSDDNRYYGFLNHKVSGSLIHIVNISDTYKVTTNNGISATIPPKNSLVAQCVDETWHVIYKGPVDLTSDGTLNIRNLIAQRLNGKYVEVTNASKTYIGANFGNVFKLSTTAAVGNVELYHYANHGIAGQEIKVIITDDAAGGHEVDFKSPFKSTGKLTGIANKTAVLTFVFDGTYWWETGRVTGL